LKGQKQTKYKKPKLKMCKLHMEQNLNPNMHLVRSWWNS